MVKPTFSIYQGKYELAIAYDGLPPSTKEEAMAITVEKWRFLRDHPEVSDNGGHDTCGLCLFCSSYCHNGCPICEYSNGISSCAASPFVDHISAKSDKARKLTAEAELRFLRKVKKWLKARSDNEN
jgi:hypothetical protein